MTDEEIDEIVDWQLSNPPERRRICLACRALWTGNAAACPECGATQ